MKFNTINYSVEIDLQSADFGLHQDEIAIINSRLKQISSHVPDFSDICSLRNGVLRYESQTLLPPQAQESKQRVLLVLSTPSIHNVKQGMFFFSRLNGDRHGFWSKVAKAGLVKVVTKNTRDQEAHMRRKMILADAASPKYTFGITTFYSFPTLGSSSARFSGSGGVETLFEPILKHLQQMESARILSYPFTDGAIIVFTRKRLLKRFYKITGVKPSYWPIRGGSSSGRELGNLLAKAGKVALNRGSLLF